MGVCPVSLNMKLFLLSCLTALAVASYADYTKLQFAQFKEKYGKTYLGRSEHQLRYQVFQENLKRIEEHNRSGATWKMAINQFSDLTQAEFQSMYLGGYKRLPTPAGNFTTVSKPAKDLAAEIDWRTKGAISDVKNQGQCGSCWAFCTTEMIESYAAIATGTLPNLSSQQVTSCTPNPCHVEVWVDVWAPSHSLATPTFSCLDMSPRTTTLTLLEAPLKQEIACMTS